MIKSIQLTNFQSHKDTTLELDPGMNVIIGSSDSGKTALIRALRWLVWNRPSGEEFRSNWGGDTIVDIDIDEGQVQRIRTKKDNLYMLGYHDEFKAMGTDIPPEIKEILNIHDINLQYQLDQPFLLTNSPGEVAAHFNKIAKLDKIDLGLSNINKWILEINRTIKFNGTEIKRHEADLTNYDHLEKFEAEVEVLEESDKMLTTLSKNKYDLIVLTQVINNTTEALEVNSEILKDEDLVNNTLDLIYKRDGLEDGPIATITELIEDIKVCEQQLEETKQLTANESQVNGLLEDQYLLEKKEQELGALTQLIDMARDAERGMISADAEYDALQDQFNDEFPDVCPLCNKPK